MTHLERLVALEDIRLLRAKYCRFIDGHEWQRLGEIMTEDAVLDLSHTGEVLGFTAPPLRGRDAIIASMNKGFTGLKRLLHIVSIPIIEFATQSSASGIWRQETYVKETRPDLPGTGIAYATAYDTYRRDPDEWRIESVRVTLDMVL